MQEFEQTCTITCTENGKTVTGEILTFVPKKRLVVSINRAVKVTLHYVPNHAIYVGDMAQREFTSKGPKEIIRRTAKRG